jgi:hypothetical protein
VQLRLRLLLLHVHDAVAVFVEHQLLHRAHPRHLFGARDPKTAIHPYPLPQLPQLPSTQTSWWGECVRERGRRRLVGWGGGGAGGGGLRETGDEVFWWCSSESSVERNFKWQIGAAHQ